MTTAETIPEKAKPKRMLARIAAPGNLVLLLGVWELFLVLSQQRGWF